MYLRKLREAVDEFHLDLAAPGQLPHGLTGLYRLWFRRQFPDRAVYRADFAPLIEVLVAASRPVPVDLLKPLFGWDTPTEARLLQGLGSLFEEQAEGVTPFHASLRDWLTDRTKSGADFVVDAARGSRRLAEALWARFLSRPETAEPDGLILAELPRLLEQQSAEVLHTLLDASAGWPTISSRLASAARNLQARFAWTQLIPWLGLTDMLGKLAGKHGLPNRSVALTAPGDALLTLGATGPALESFRAGQAVDERLVALNPEAIDPMRDLSVSHNKIGDVLRAQGDLPRALDAFRAAMDISARLAAADTGNAQWQRDLSVSHERSATRSSRSAICHARSTHFAPPWTSAPASPPPTPETPNGSATSPSATSGSATCSARRAICRARSTPFAPPWTSALASPPPTPETPNRSAM